MLYEFCPLCMKNGLQKKMQAIQINFVEAVWMCENEECVWPFGYEEFILLHHPVDETRSYFRDQTKSNVIETKERISVPEFSIYTSPVTLSNENSSKQCITDTSRSDNSSNNHSQTNNLLECDTSVLDVFLSLLSDGDDVSQSQVVKKSSTTEEENFPIAINGSRYVKNHSVPVSDIKQENSIKESSIAKTIHLKKIPKILSMEKTNIDISRFKSHSEDSIDGDLVLDSSNKISTTLPTCTVALANNDSECNTELDTSSHNVLNSSKIVNVIATKSMDRKSMKDALTLETSVSELHNPNYNLYSESDHVSNNKTTNNSNSLNKRLGRPESLLPQQIETMRMKSSPSQGTRISDIPSLKKRKLEDTFNSTNNLLPSTNIVQTIKLNNLPPIVISYKNPQDTNVPPTTVESHNQSCAKPSRRKGKVNNADTRRRKESDFKCYEKFKFSKKINKLNNNSADTSNHLITTANTDNRQNNITNVDKTEKLEQDRIKSELPVEVKSEPIVIKSEVEVKSEPIKIKSEVKNLEERCKEQNEVHLNMSNNDNNFTDATNLESSSDPALNTSTCLDDFLNDILTNTVNMENINVDNDWLDYLLV